MKVTSYEIHKSIYCASTNPQKAHNIIKKNQSLIGLKEKAIIGSKNK